LDLKSKAKGRERGEDRGRRPEFGGWRRMANGSGQKPEARAQPLAQGIC